MNNQHLFRVVLVSFLLAGANGVALADKNEAIIEVGKAVENSGYWFKNKAVEKGDHFLNSVIESFAKSIVENVNKFFFTGYVAPRFNSYFSKAVAPYAYDMAETVVNYRHKLEELILDPDTFVQVRGFVKNLKIADEKNKGLPRMILYGAPGVGKTEIARRIVNEGNFMMKMITGGELSRMTPDQIKHLMNFINVDHGNGKKVILFIDEAETLFKEGYGRRSPQLQNFIAATGSRSPNFTVIAATNFAEQFDEAAFRRFDYKVRIRLPAPEERTKIFVYYLKQYLREASSVNMDWSLLQKQTFMDVFLTSTDGLSPSDIQQLAELVVAEAEMRGGQIEEKRVIYRVEELQDKKNELVAQRESAQRKRREDARSAYFEEQMNKKYSELDDEGDDGDDKSGQGKGSEK